MTALLVIGLLVFFGFKALVVGGILFGGFLD